ncbi:unnamed protein product [Brassicogethes aeneus]|uniref:C3H1-type domain-containing protein n=1 Tax=Brassicogethes aeneus TaxID=1431903 RepID=A0A9P0B7K3_BRAAE|nr:unnamed protein product [Brassicogethes aeneus]
MAMVNMNNLLNGKDSRWLQLEVCREFQRNKCSRPDTECKFAHPPANVEVQNGRVTACYDSIKGRCNREKPPCKYFHPPQHLKDQLLINGRNHLALKNALMQQMGLTPGQPIVPGQVQAVAANPYLTGMPQVGSTYSPYFAPGPIMPTIMGPDPTGVGSPLGVVPQTVVQQKMQRSDRLEVCREYQRGACKRAESECRFAHPADSVTANEDGTVTVCMDAVKGRCNRDPCRYFHPPLHLQAQIKAAQSRANAMDMKSVGSFYYENFQGFPGMMPYKRPAADKSGVPVYQPNATTYQQLMQLQQPFVPVSCEYSASPAPPPTTCASPPTPDTASQQQSQQHPLGSSTPTAQQQQAAAAAVAAHMSKQQQQQQSENENAAAAQQVFSAHSVATSAAANAVAAAALLSSQTNTIHDPAALAKEVAQQNYAKAVKMAQVNQSIAASQLQQHLNPLNYTGVALNKQTLSMPPPTYARFPQLPLGFTTNLNLGHLNHYQAAAMAQQNLLNLTRPPPSHMINPYSLMRNPYATTAPQGANPTFSNGLLGAQYPVTVSAAPMTNVSATAAAAAVAQNNNNNVVMQPYKKLKTT